MIPDGGRISRFFCGSTIRPADSGRLSGDCPFLFRFFDMLLSRKSDYPL